MPAPLRYPRERCRGQARKKFYSYADRHLDVLVDTNGTVINLGLY